MKLFTRDANNFKCKKFKFIIMFVYCAFFANLIKAQAISATIAITNSGTSSSQANTLLCYGNTIKFTANEVLTGYCPTPTLSYAWSYTYPGSGGPIA